jgi:DNA-cytosine methyltransferase
MRPLPAPESDGSVDGLRKLLNIREGEDGDGDFILAIAYLLACLRGRGPYPVEAIGGEQGSAKSTRSKLLRNVIDPRHPELRSLPRDERDLVVAARNQHVLAFDNVSGLRLWQSDALCRIASGAGFGTRELYTDQEEVLFSGARPIILNGIEEVIERPDLAERSIFSTCEPIASKDRLSEVEVLAAFGETHASVLGALLDAAATGLRRFSEIRPPNLPRMADFAHWVIACEAALWKDGDFLRAYNANIQGAVESVLEASPVAVAVREMMAALAKEVPPRTKWEGTAGALLTKQTDRVAERVSKSGDWPSNGRALSGRLRRAASFLRRVWIDIAFGRGGHAHARQIVIKAAAVSDTPASESVKGGTFASVPSAPSAFGTGPSAAVPDADGADGTDAKIRTSTASDGISEQSEHKEPRRPTRTFYEFFAGGGLARIALGPDWRCAFANDIAPEKVRSYIKNFSGEGLRVCDVAHLTIADLPGVADLVWASPPCVGASLAGRRKGLGPEAWAFLELMQRLCAEGRRPPLIAIENVPALLTSVDGTDFDRICDRLTDAGYRYGVLVVDASLFTPQSRKRLFVIAVDRALPIPIEIVADEPMAPFHPLLLVKALRRQREPPLWFRPPLPATRNTILADLIEDQLTAVRWDKRVETDAKIATMNADNLAKLEAMKRAGKQVTQGVFWRGGRPGPKGKVSRWEVRDDGIAGCLRTASGGSSVQSILVVEGDTVQSRRLTPREYARLMGLSDSYELPENATEGYDLVGDGVVVPVVRHIVERIIEPILVANVLEPILIEQEFGG